MEEKGKTSRSRVKASVIVFLVLSVAWAGVIFWFSSFDGGSSANRSGRITGLLQKLFFPDWAKLSEESFSLHLSELHYLVRKAAHFLEFAVFGALLSGFYGSLLKKNRLSFLLAFLTGVSYGVLDEVHQLIVSERSMLVFDMVVDSVGVLFGCFAGFALLFLFAQSANGKNTSPDRAVPGLTKTEESK